MRLGEWDNAQASLKQAIELRPDDASAWAHLAEALAAQNRLPAATAALRLAVYLAADRKTALGHLRGAGRSQQHPAFQALVQRNSFNQLPIRPTHP